VDDRKQVEERLIELLKIRLGVPDEAILLDPVFTNAKGVQGCRPDVVIIDPATKEALAILEVKSRLTEDKKAKYREQVASYADIDPERRLPTYLVTGKDDGGVRFDLLTQENDFEEVGENAIPTYASLKASNITVKLNAVQIEQKRSADSFRMLCNLAAILSMILFALDVYFKDFHKPPFELLNSSRMILLGAVAALIIIPYAQKFKGLGIEYERIVSSAKN
jgi:hypothetical protein